MPSRRRSLLLAFAVVAFVFSSAGDAPVARSGGEDARRAGTPAPVDRPTPTRRHFRRHVAPKPTLGERAARIAVTAVGVPYRWGGSTPASGFDCSGLVYWAFGRVGVEVPHSSYALYEQGRRVARSRLKAGDLLFFYGLGHVGVYIGRGRMVHAPSSGRHVEIVTLARSHYAERLVGARRILPA
jgi:cell wall-associated NlpC family hydrolase